MNCIYVNKLLQALNVQTDRMTTCIKVELWPTTCSTPPWKLTLSHLAKARQLSLVIIQGI